jgi:hypothetical protein
MTEVEFDPEEHRNGQTIDITPAWKDLLPTIVQMYSMVETNKAKNDLLDEVKRAGKILDAMIPFIKAIHPLIDKGRQGDFNMAEVTDLYQNIVRISRNKNHGS